MTTELYEHLTKFSLALVSNECLLNQRLQRKKAIKKVNL